MIKNYHGTQHVKMFFWNDKKLVKNNFQCLALEGGILAP